MYKILTTLCILGTVVKVECVSKHVYNILRDKYSDLYYKKSKAAQEQTPNTTAVVELSAFIQHVVLNEDEQMLEVGGYFEVWWVDKLMSWDPEKYGGVDKIRYGGYFWKPDLALYNGFIEGLRRSSDARTYIIAYNNGEHLWYPNVVMKTFCPIDHTNFPFDEQKCKIMIGSWTYSQARLDLRLYHGPDNQSAGVDYGFFEDVNPQWEVSSVTEARVSNFWDENEFIHIEIGMRLKRRFTLYAGTIMTNLGVSSFLAVLMFILPPWHRHKLIPGLMAAVILFALLIHLSCALPAMANTPKIVTVCKTNLIIVCTAILCSVILINLSLRTFAVTKDPPGIVLSLLQGLPGKLLCINGSDGSSQTHGNYQRTMARGNSEDNVYLSDVRVSSREVDGWKLTALAIDRIMLVVFAVSFLITTTSS